MANINLKPWRELKRKRQVKRFVFCWLAFLIVGLAIAIMLFLHANNQVRIQDNRNDLIKGEIAQVETSIAELNGLQKEREQLIDRVELIRALQGERSDVVHVFDQLPKVVPGDLYLKSMDYRNGVFKVKGEASNNSEISGFMRNLEASEWFKEPNLSKVVSGRGKSTSSFDLTFKLEHERGK